MQLGHPGSAADWERIREICCETGAAGPVPGRRPFFGELWVGPYQKLNPEWTFVARSEGKVIGYLTGCPSTAPFYVRRFFRHRLPLFAAALLGRWGSTEDTRRFLFPLEGVRRNFALRFGPRLYARLMRRYPAHLHINLTESARGSGVGRMLIEAYVDALEARGVRGLHLFCGKNPVPFYRRTGFHRLACLDLGRGPVYIMARRLRPVKR